MAKAKVTSTSADVLRISKELVMLEEKRAESIIETHRITQAIKEKRSELNRAIRGRIDVSGLKQDDMPDLRREDGLHEAVEEIG